MKILKQYPLTCFLILHFLLWSLLPLLRSSLPMDSIEAIVWGQYCDWGTNKHPALSGHLAYWFYMLGGHSHYAVYALSQLCVLLGFIYLFKLATCFMPREQAVLSVMLLEGVIYYGFSALEFNVNVVSLALWPMTAYHFYQALSRNRLPDWILTGVFAGLNLFNKYVSGILLMAMLLLMLCDKKARNKFKTFGPYAAAISCLLIIVPHCYWLYRHDFFVMEYFLKRSEHAGFENIPLLRHIIYPLRFFAAQVLFGLGTLLVYFTATHKAPREVPIMNAFQRHFLLFLGLAPLVIMTAISMIGGIKLKSMWGFPVLYMLPILLFKFFPVVFSETNKKKTIRGVYLLMFLMAAAQICVITFNKSDKLHLDAPDYAWQMEKIWLEKTGGRPFKYVAGDVWWADNAALYAPSQPKPVIWGDPARNPWFDAQDMAASGALIITGGESEYNAVADVLKNITAPQTLQVECKNPAGKIKRKTIYYGFYNL